MILTSGWWSWGRRRKNKRNTGRIWRGSENQNQNLKRWYNNRLIHQSLQSVQLHSSGGWSWHDGYDGILRFWNIFEEDLMDKNILTSEAVMSNCNVIVLSAYIFDLVNCELHFLEKWRADLFLPIAVDSASHPVLLQKVTNYHGRCGCKHGWSKASWGAASSCVPTPWPTHPSRSETDLQVFSPDFLSRQSFQRHCIFSVRAWDQLIQTSVLLWKSRVRLHFRSHPNHCALQKLPLYKVCLPIQQGFLYRRLHFWIDVLLNHLLPKRREGRAQYDFRLLKDGCEG